MDDASIIQMFWDRQEQAIQETDNKYGKLCYRIANNIVSTNEDSEECVNDAYLKIWNSIPDDRPEHFSAYICQIVKRIALNKLRYYKTERRNTECSVSLDELSNIVSGEQSPDETIIVEELSKSINIFLAQQEKRDRQMFVRRYWYYDSVESIANVFGMNPRSVSTILFRMRKRLKKHLQKEGFEL